MRPGGATAGLHRASLSPADTLEAPGDVLVLTKGGITISIEKNDARSFFGAFGDVHFILGLFFMGQILSAPE